MVFPLCGMKSFHYLYTQIAGRQQQFQWQVNLRVAIAEQFFVDDCQERVLYGRPGLSYLVEEHHVSRWQITLRVTLVFVRVLQFADAHGAEYLVWRAEARHQILKRPRIQPQ